MKRFFILATCAVLLFACSDEKKDEPKTGESTTTADAGKDKKPAATEVLELSTADVVKKSFAAFSKGDIDGMTADFDDNIRYTWSGGDSAIGKKAVQDYYKTRWALIQSLSFSDEIILPLQVNESQQPKVAPPGKWVLYWAKVDVTYKNGKKITFWSHSVNHQNAGGKVDFVGQYIDFAPIKEATKDMMKK